MMKSYLLILILLVIGPGSALAEIPGIGKKYTILGICICDQKVDEYLNSVYPTSSLKDTDVNCMVETDENKNLCQAMTASVEAQAMINCLVEANAKVDSCKVQVITNY